MEEEEHQLNASYRPFVFLSLFFIPLAVVVDFSLLGFLPDYRFVHYMPVIILILMAAVIVSSLRLKFNPAVIIVLLIETILLAPPLFLLLHRLISGHYDYDFFKTLFA